MSLFLSQTGVCGKLADWHVLTREIPEIIYPYHPNLAKVLSSLGIVME
jgi:hypothetical protein